MARSIPQGTERALFASSGGRCARCFIRIIEGQKTSDDISVIGEIVHIRGKNPGSSRYDSNMSDYERDSYDNLIVLCANCHKIVDDQPGTYTVAKLQTLKRTHEENIVRIICRGVPDVMFNELEMVTKYIVSGQAAGEGTYELATPKEKIRKNDLSASVEGMIKMGMARVTEVRKFVSGQPDMQFGMRLKAGFVSEYKKLLEGGLKSDLLFMSLVRFAAGRSGNESAGLVVLVYLFESCEVFEK